jgi:hypothetical protein
MKPILLAILLASSTACTGALAGATFGIDHPIYAPGIISGCTHCHLTGSNAQRQPDGTLAPDLWSRAFRQSVEARFPGSKELHASGARVIVARSHVPPEQQAEAQRYLVCLLYPGTKVCRAVGGPVQ